MNTYDKHQTLRRICWLIIAVCLGVILYIAWWL
jgi:phage shock protein PspC (stress-responsive transcriptional regulator)